MVAGGLCISRVVDKNQACFVNGLGDLLMRKEPYGEEYYVLGGLGGWELGKKAEKESSMVVRFFCKLSNKVGKVGAEFKKGIQLLVG